MLPLPSAVAEENLPMSGPIVRSGASPEYTKNWDAVFASDETAPKKKAVTTATTAKKKAAKRKKK
jgi:hypothetical protein